MVNWSRWCELLVKWNDHWNRIVCNVVEGRKQEQRLVLYWSRTDQFVHRCPPLTTLTTLTIRLDPSVLFFSPRPAQRSFNDPCSSVFRLVHRIFFSLDHVYAVTLYTQWSLSFVPWRMHTRAFTRVKTVVYNRWTPPSHSPCGPHDLHYER